ncbi:MAG: CinA family protein [Chitinophagales bacterium]
MPKGNKHVLDGVTEAKLEAILKKQKATVAFAESCTGGYLSYLFTSSTKLSSYFLGSVISYSPLVKQQVLKVDKQVVQYEEAVNEQCAAQMLSGLLKSIKASYGIAITGFAGPNGGTTETEVGTVWLAVGNNKKHFSKKLVFGKNRDKNIQLFAISAIHFLLEYLTEENI